MAAKRAAMIRCLRVIGRMPRWITIALIAVIIPLATVVTLNVTRPQVAHAASGYLLPYQGGTAQVVSEGNNTGDHMGIEAWAWDFSMTGGTNVFAARGGTVTQIKQDSNSGCADPSCADDGNYVVIDHGDGTQALYLHLQLNSLRVALHDVVSQGQVIGLSGTTGYVTRPELEFMVEQSSSTAWSTQTVPITFDDVSGGVPTTGHQYTSGNYPGGGSCLNAPSLTAPSNGATVTNDTVNFSWSAASGCSLSPEDGYTFRINQSSDPNASPIVDTSVGASSPSYSYTFGTDGVYWWHVRVCAPCTPANPGVWSDSSFTIDTSNAGAPDAPVLQSPGNGVSENSDTVTFAWAPSDSPSVTGYTLHVSTSSTIDGSGAPLILNTSVTGTSYTYTFSQDYTTLWWSVAAVNASAQQGSFAPAWTLATNTTTLGAPDSPTLQSPSNGGYTSSTSVTFSWLPSDSPNIKGYTIHVTMNSIITGPGSVLYLNTTVTGTSITTIDLPDGIYNVLWSVAALNTSNQLGGFAVPRKLTIDDGLFAMSLASPTTTEWGVATCYNDVLTLKVNVTVGLYVTSVDFRRSDSTLNGWVDIGNLTSPANGGSYQESLDCSTIPPFWNQIWISATNELGNRLTKDFWVYHYPPAVAPTALTAQAASCSEVDLSWTDNSGGQDGFNIYLNGSLEGQVGVGTTSFQDIGVSGSTTYSYTVTATSGTVESSPTDAVSITTPACPPPPTVTFTEPVSDGGTALCTSNGTVTFQVSATSALGISSVQFYRYDPVIGLPIPLDTTASDPYYGATVSCRGLVHGWNMVFVYAYDTNYNATFDYVWIYLPRPQAGPGGNCADEPHGCQV